VTDAVQNLDGVSWCHDGGRVHQSRGLVGRGVLGLHGSPLLGLADRGRLLPVPNPSGNRTLGGPSPDGAGPGREDDYILRYLHEEDVRRRVQLQLNRGESRHDLARWLFFANQGEFRTGDYEQIMNKASCLSLLSNAVLVWNTVRMGEIVARLRAAGETVSDEDLARTSPLACACDPQRNLCVQPISLEGSIDVAALPEVSQTGSSDPNRLLSRRFNLRSR
jgi:hypothetical protein